MEKTENYWKEQYEMLFKEFLRQQEQLKQWEAGGILWTWEDVHIYASEEMSIRLTTDEARAILAEVIESHNPDEGITWQTFRNEIKNLFK